MGANGRYRPLGRERTFNPLLHKRNASQWMPAITFCVSSGWWPALNRWSSWKVSSSAVVDLGSGVIGGVPEETGLACQRCTSGAGGRHPSEECGRCL